MEKKTTSSRNRLKPHAAIEAINSKYDYEDVSYFLETVYNTIVFQGTISLQKDHVRTIVYYVEFVLSRILDSSQIEDSMRITVSKYSKTSIHQKLYPHKAKEEISGGQKLPFQDLIKWLKRINNIKEITLVRLLDEFFKSFPRPVRNPN